MQPASIIAIGFRQPKTVAATYGRLYGSTSSATYTTARVYYGASYGSISGSSEQLIGTMTSSPLNVSMKKSTGVDFDGSEYVALTIYRRTKLTTGSWSYVIDYAPYSSGTYSADFSTYDYKLVLEDAI